MKIQILVNAKQIVDISGTFYPTLRVFKQILRIPIPLCVKAGFSDRATFKHVFRSMISCFFTKKLVKMISSQTYV